MADIEKVIKGLKCCTSNCCMAIKCDECPYGNICYREGRCGTMMLNALELLKEHKEHEELLTKLGYHWTGSGETLALCKKSKDGEQE